MALLVSAPFVPRPRRGLALLIPALVLATAPGCGKHHRTSLRPVYVGPATVAPAAACPTPVPSRIEPGLAAPTSTTTSSTSSSFIESMPPLDAPVSPASTSPPRPAQPDEPGLDQPAPAGGSSAVPNLNGPGAPVNKGFKSGARTPTGRLRQTSLREELRPYVNDPADLFSPPKADRPWKYVVLHHSARPSGGYDEIDHEHRKVLGWSGCGYHFVIGNGTGSPDGQVEVARRWAEQKHGVHCRDARVADANEYGIGICLVGDLDDGPPTPRQVAAARALIAYLGDRYAIPPDHIGSHAQLAGTPTACPGKNFPAQAILGPRSLARR